MRDVLVLGLFPLVPLGIAMYFLMGGPGSRQVARSVQRAMESGWLAKGAGIAVVAVTVIAVAIGFARRRSLGEAWVEFAGRHGFTHEGASLEHPSGRVRGHRDGRDVELGVVAVRDLHDRRKATLIQLRVEVPGAPAGLSIRRDLPSPAFLDDVAAAAEGALSVPSDLETGDAVFDADHDVRAADPVAARAWLTPARRAALVPLLANEGFVLSAGHVAWQTKLGNPGVEELTSTLTRLEDGAARLGR
ncbi:MAG: hypothetical protein AAF628_25295 [Planctomycetota bacterium]